MQNKQPIVDAIILPFIAPPRPSVELTARDRLEIHAFRHFARQNGFDRLIIHERDPGDAPELGNYLAIYREGEVWSSWSVARQGARISAWSSVSGVDAGPFTSMTEALSQLLGSQMPPVRHPTRHAKLAPRNPPASDALQAPTARPIRVRADCDEFQQYPCRYARACANARGCE